MLDPVLALSLLAHAVLYFYNAASATEDNSRETRRLAGHAQDVLRLIEAQVATEGGLAQDVADRLTTLANTLMDLATTVESLRRKPVLRRLLWRDTVAEKIALVYRQMTDAVHLFNLGAQVDLRKFQRENEEARRRDAKRAHATYEKVLDNDQAIIELLGVQSAQMEEAMETIQQRLRQIDDNLERRFLERGMHALQRRSASASTSSSATRRRAGAPDPTIIASLDVLIHEHVRLGAGGFGQVFRGEWHGATVAVKVMDHGVPEAVLEQEIRVWKRLRHPHVLQFLGACLRPTGTDLPFVVSTYKTNRDALAFLRAHPDASRLKLLQQAALGLVYLHQNAVIHGDLKASNILVDEQGSACLADFGLSKVKLHTTSRNANQSSSARASGSSSTPNTSSPQAQAHGTARWMAPEQMAQGRLDKATDIYSFGMTACEVFTGDPPFAHTADALLYTLVVEKRMRPSKPAGVDTRAWCLMEACWAHKSAKRPSAKDVAATLGELSRAEADAATGTGEITTISKLSTTAVVGTPGRLVTQNQVTATAAAPATAPATRDLELTTRPARATSGGTLLRKKSPISGPSAWTVSSSDPSSSVTSPATRPVPLRSASAPTSSTPKSMSTRARASSSSLLSSQTTVSRRTSSTAVDQSASPASLQQKGATGVIFGIPLVECLKLAPADVTRRMANGKTVVVGRVPLVVARCGWWLRNHHTELKINPWRASISDKRTDNMVAVFETPPKYGANFEWKGSKEPYTLLHVAAVFRQYFLVLPGGVVPTHFHGQPMVSNMTIYEDSVVETYKALLHSLPPENMRLFIYLLDLLHLYSVHLHKFGVTARDLAFDFVNGIFHSAALFSVGLFAFADAVEFMIQHRHHWSQTG